MFFYKYLPWFSYNLNKKIHGSLSTNWFASDNILKIIKNLEPNKAYGDDMIGIQMVRLCDVSHCKPLESIFKSCLEKK